LTEAWMSQPAPCSTRGKFVICLAGLSPLEFPHRGSGHCAPACGKAAGTGSGRPGPLVAARPRSSTEPPTRSRSPGPYLRSRRYLQTLPAELGRRLGSLCASRVPPAAQLPTAAVPSREAEPGLSVVATSVPAAGPGGCVPGRAARGLRASSGKVGARAPRVQPRRQRWPGRGGGGDASRPAREAGGGGRKWKPGSREPGRAAGGRAALRCPASPRPRADSRSGDARAGPAPRVRPPPAAWHGGSGCLACRPLSPPLPRWRPGTPRLQPRLPAPWPPPPPLAAARLSPARSSHGATALPGA
jgi:hypothetical protein